MSTKKQTAIYCEAFMNRKYPQEGKAIPKVILDLMALEWKTDDYMCAIYDGKFGTHHNPTTSFVSAKRDKDEPAWCHFTFKEIEALIKAGILPEGSYQKDGANYRVSVAHTRILSQFLSQVAAMWADYERRLEYVDVYEYVGQSAFED